MTVSDTYGTNSCTAKELTRLLADRLDVTFTERESDYLGVYFLATLADTTHLQVQPNAVRVGTEASVLLADIVNTRRLLTHTRNG